MRKDFFRVPRTYYTTSYTKTQVPMFFYKTALRAVNYFVEYDRVLPVLRGTGLLPVRFFNGKALASLTFFNYQKVTCFSESPRKKASPLMCARLLRLTSMPTWVASRRRA